MTDKLRPADETLLAYAAGTLPPEKAAAVKAALAADPEARAKLSDWERQNRALVALYGPVADEPVPDRMLDTVRAARAAEAGPNARRRAWLAAAVIAAVAVGAGGGWAARGTLTPQPQAVAVVDAAMRAWATYSVEVMHPVEVRADDAVHLTNWLSRRLGHQISPPDFAAVGFTLMGGRVVPADGGTAAMLMYDNAAGQRITLYVAADKEDRETAFRFAEGDGVQAFVWTDRDLSYAVVGAVPRETLRRIALAAYDQMA